MYHDHKIFSWTHVHTYIFYFKLQWRQASLDYPEQESALPINSMQWPHGYGKEALLPQGSLFIPTHMRMLKRRGQS